MVAIPDLGNHFWRLLYQLCNVHNLAEGLDKYAEVSLCQSAHCFVNFPLTLMGDFDEAGLGALADAAGVAVSACAAADSFGGASIVVASCLFA